MRTALLLAALALAGCSDDEPPPICAEGCCAPTDCPSGFTFDCRINRCLVVAPAPDAPPALHD